MEQSVLPLRASSTTSERDPPNAGLPQERNGSFRNINDSINRENDLLKALEEQEFALQETKHELQTVLQAKDEIQREWKQATKDLNRLQAERNYKVDDDFLIAAYKQLRYDIKNWAYQHFDGELKLNGFNKEPRYEVKLMTLDVKNFIDSPRQRPMLIQSIVWYQVMVRVFQPQGYNRGLLWAGGEHQALRTLYGALDPGFRRDNSTPSQTELKEFHRWRAITASLLEANASQAATDQRIRAISDDINKIVKPYITLKTADYDKALFKFVAKAAQLDCEFHKQRAQLFIEMAKFPPRLLLHGYEARSTFCEIGDGEEGQYVHFCIAPMLRKRGSSDGDNYDQTAMLVKAQVCLEPPELAKKQAQQTSPQVPRKDAPQKEAPAQSQQSQDLGVPFVAYSQAGSPNAVVRRPTNSVASMTSKSGSKDSRSNSDSKLKKLGRYLADPSRQQHNSSENRKTGGR